VGRVARIGSGVQVVLEICGEFVSGSRSCMELQQRDFSRGSGSLPSLIVTVSYLDFVLQRVSRTELIPSPLQSSNLCILHVHSDSQHHYFKPHDPFKISMRARRELW
jgi:hypothetical protein